LPYYLAEDIHPPHETSLFPQSFLRLASLLGEPPDPPPRLSSIS
jgi:hypothetical protein